MTTDNHDDITVWHHSDVSFIPSRFFPQLGDELTPATACSLVREFGECPTCGNDIDPDVKDAVKEDRDVLWHDNAVQPYRSSAHVCSECDERLEIFVEEGARPAQWSEIPDKFWADRFLWIKMENGNYFVTNPGDIRIWSVK